MHPNNLVLVMMGVGLLWVGWCGFNAGSSLSSGVKTAQALTVAQVAAASAGWLASGTAVCCPTQIVRLLIHLNLR